MMTRKRWNRVSRAARWDSVISAYGGKNLTSFVVLGMAVVLSGCAGETALGQSTHLAHSSDPQLTAEDHRAIALLYQHEAARLEADAQRYQNQVAGLRPEEDPKGNRRAGWQTASRETQKRATDLQTLAARHQDQAQTRTGQQRKE
jgi:hypothetical protein